VFPTLGIPLFTHNLICIGGVGELIRRLKVAVLPCQQDLEVFVLISSLYLKMESSMLEKSAPTAQVSGLHQEPFTDVDEKRAMVSFIACNTPEIGISQLTIIIARAELRHH